MNNTWTNIGETKTIQLKKPDRYGVYQASGDTQEIDNYLANEYIALIVEFHVTVSNSNGNQQSYLCGYQTILPELNTIGAPKEM